MGEGTRKVGSIERIIGRISSLSRRDRSESLGRCRNRRSSEAGAGELLLEELLMAINKGETLIGESVTGCTGEDGKGLGKFEL